MRERELTGSAFQHKTEKSMGEIIDARLSRRGVLKTLFAAGVAGALSGKGLGVLTKPAQAD